MKGFPLRDMDEATSGPRPTRNGAEPARFVLLVASDLDLARSLEGALARRGHPPIITQSLDEGLQLLSGANFRLLVLALPLPGMTGRDAIARLKAVDEGIPFIVVGVDEALTAAGEAFDLGAQEHLLDPRADPSDFLATV